MPRSSPSASGPYRVKEAFAVPDGDGFLRVYRVGALVGESDPIATTHGDLLEPASSRVVEQATAGPGERRSLRLPSRVTDKQATQHRTGHAHTTGTGVDMPHLLPPEHPDSPASPFAPGQPALGVVADDVPDEQNKAGKPKAADAPNVAADVEAVDTQNADKVDEPPADDKKTPAKK